MLGGAQWLATLGFATGATLRPVQVVVDATDLVALPAVLAAWWVARDRMPGTLSRPAKRIWKPDPRRWQGVAIVTVAAVASLATSRGAAFERADDSQAIQLDVARSIAVRHFSWHVVNRDPTLQSVAFSAGIRQTTEEIAVQFSALGVELTVVPDDPRQVAPDSADHLDDQYLDLRDCLTECSGGATVIVRLRDGAMKPRALTLDASLTANGGYEETDIDVDVALREDRERRFDGPPPTVSATEAMTLRVSSDAPVAGATLLLKVDAATLPAPLAYPIAGRVVSRLETSDASGDRDAFHASVSIGSQVQGNPGRERVLDRDFLRECATADPCEVPITIEINYDPSERASGGFVEVTWDVQALLQAFDGRRVAPTSVVLERVVP